VRGGAIVPLGPEMNFVGEKPSDPVDFQIYVDSSGRSGSSPYEDDGSTFDYQRNLVRRTAVTAVRSPGGTAGGTACPTSPHRPFSSLGVSRPPLATIPLLNN